MERNGGTLVKVMTDEQIEVLRKQIAAYASISEQLEELHRSLTHNDDHLAGGVRMGNPYSTPLMASASQKLSRRQRWNPTPEQLHILERVFDQEGIKTPNPPKVKEITAELAHHGQITESNVYNWFQNRRARMKKKQMLEAEANNTAESEAEMVVKSFDAKVTEEQNFPSDERLWKRSNEEFCQANTVAITPAVSLRSPRGRPSSDFTKMPIRGRISREENHNPPLPNTRNCTNTGDRWWPNIS